MPVPNPTEFRQFAKNPQGAAKIRQLMAETRGQTKEIVGFWLEEGYSPVDIYAAMIQAIFSEIKEQE